MSTTGHVTSVWVPPAQILRLPWAVPRHYRTLVSQTHTWPASSERFVQVLVAFILNKRSSSFTLDIISHAFFFFRIVDSIEIWTLYGLYSFFSLIRIICWQTMRSRAWRQWVPISWRQDAVVATSFSGTLKVRKLIECTYVLKWVPFSTERSKGSPILFCISCKSVFLSSPTYSIEM